MTVGLRATRRVPVVVILVGGFALGCGVEPGAAPSGGTGSGAVAGEGGAVVRRVVDGDTVVVRIAGEAEDDTVRLIGIDTPETKKPGAAVECFGERAADRLRELLPEQTVVRLERDVEARDRYGRLLAYVYLSDGTFVNLAMVTDGFAAPLTIAPNVAYTDRFTTEARTARTEKRGLWSACGGPHEKPR